MSKERELLERVMDLIDYRYAQSEAVAVHREIKELLAKTEHIVDVTDMVEPVAWITEWVQRYRHNDTPLIDRAVSFTKGDAPAVPNPNYIPLYTAPPKREPIEDGELEVWYSQHTWAMDKQEYMWGFRAYMAGCRDAEKAHGIGGE